MADIPISRIVLLLSARPDSCSCQHFLIIFKTVALFPIRPDSRTMSDIKFSKNERVCDCAMQPITHSAHTEPVREYVHGLFWSAITLLATAL